ncbi:MAG TPA: hypothetical protein PLC98_16315 [Anaerolineales bacterium]|nr:hypothetical protein [Anaerolineales bacterium]
MMTLYTSFFHGVPLTTGDIICTTDGEQDSLFGRFWQMMGQLAPGDVDHCILYLGPGGRCIESGARGVITFTMPGEVWDAAALVDERWLLDRFYGVAYPLADLGLAPEDERGIRERVADFCLRQAISSKPYNPNFFNPDTDGAYYCSQLIYRAYLAEGIDLNTNHGMPAGLFAPIVFPQELWNTCPHLKREPPE